MKIRRNEKILSYLITWNIPGTFKRHSQNIPETTLRSEDIVKREIILYHAMLNKANKWHNTE